MCLLEPTIRLWRLSQAGPGRALNILSARPTKAKQFAFVPVAQRIERGPAEAEIEVRFLVGTHHDTLHSAL